MVNGRLNGFDSKFFYKSDSITDFDFYNITLVLTGASQKTMCPQEDLGPWVQSPVNGRRFTFSGPSPCPRRAHVQRAAENKSVVFLVPIGTQITDQLELHLSVTWDSGIWIVQDCSFSKPVLMKVEIARIVSSKCDWFGKLLGHES